MTRVRLRKEFLPYNDFFAGRTGRIRMVPRDVPAKRTGVMIWGVVGKAPDP